MAIEHHWKVGTTEPQTFQLYINEALGTDLTGVTLAVECWDKYDRPVTLSGTVAWVDATVPSWSYTPDGQLLPALSPYKARLQLTDGSAIAYAPGNPTGENPPDLWYVDEP